MNNSTFLVEHNRLMGDLKTALQSDIARIAIDANGGRSILFVYPPIDEEAYIAEARQQLENCMFIDLRELFVKFIDETGIDDFKESYQDFGNELFVSKNFEEGTFLSMILSEIKKAFDEGKVPVLIHTGTIYGMGFSNIHIMEQDFVMNSSIPLVVFYPATIENNQIVFLGKQVASRYRCVVVK
ncbi:MAG: hypothetical protein HUK14_08945 [Muribaculaceae bacterium]|nr:hypothetical protein [Muribaculaceae bacterium]